MKKVYLACVSIIFIIACGGDGVGTPDLIYPINGEQVAVPFTFIWSSVDNSDRYRVEVDTDVSFSSPVILVDVNDTTYAAANVSNGAYYWRVAAYGENDGLGEFALPHSFNIATGSEPQDFSIAAANSGLSVLLSWTESIAGQPDNYHVYFREVNTTAWVLIVTLNGNVLNFTHTPSEMTGDYYVAAVFVGSEYDSDIMTTIPVHTAETTIGELEAPLNPGYGWSVVGDFTGNTYTMASSANADSVDLYVTNFTNDPVGGPWYTPWSIASPNMAPFDPGGSYVPNANWHQNWFSDPIVDPQTALPNYGPTTYFNYTEGIETDPTHIAVYISAGGYYALVRFSSINPTQGTIQIESWIQAINGLRLIAH